MLATAQTDPAAPSVRRMPVTTVLAIDGVHVAALATLAAWARIDQRHRLGRSANGLLGCACIAATGFGLAVIAVRKTKSRGRGQAGRPSRGGTASPVALIVAGGVINTQGAVRMAVSHRDDPVTVTTAAALLVGGDMLTALYLARIKAHAGRR